MRWHLLLLFSLLLSSVLTAWATPERQLAGIRIGMKPGDVTALLGPPTARLIAQPPIVVRTATLSTSMEDVRSGMGATATAPVPEEKPNTLVFLWNDQEIEIGNTDVSSSESSGGGSSSSGGIGSIPLWAYEVRALKLALDQQEYIYQINDTYALGITITGQSVEAKVTDIIACSFIPFRYSPRTGKLLPVQPFDFKYSKDTRKQFKPLLLPETSKFASIGSTYGDVLKKHRWPQYMFPFVTSDLSRITLSNNPAPVSVPVGLRGGGSATSATSASSSGSGDSTPASGEKQITFTDGQDALINAGFTRNCLMLYTADNVAFTLVNFLVVRIQIGSGVIAPPPPRILH